MEMRILPGLIQSSNFVDKGPGDGVRLRTVSFRIRSESLECEAALRLKCCIYLIFVGLFPGSVLRSKNCEFNKNTWHKTLQNLTQMLRQNEHDWGLNKQTTHPLPYFPSEVLVFVARTCTTAIHEQGAVDILKVILSVTDMCGQITNHGYAQLPNP